MTRLGLVMYVVTLSASFGAGGAIIGPAVAERLGVPFLDRAVPAQVARDLGVSLDHVTPRDEQVKGWLHRLLGSVAPMASDCLIGYESHAPRMALLSDTEFLRCTERAICTTIKGGGGVILGRAGALVLRDHPHALHVRLDGDVQRRVQQTMRELSVTEAQARDLVERNDNARTAYVRRFYRADASDPKLYHLLLDSTRVPLATCVDLIAAAAAEKTPLSG
ncbi:MAG TPA: cytidylate kinase-like family protein [Pseudonocardia sp.]